MNCRKGAFTNARELCSKYKNILPCAGFMYIMYSIEKYGAYVCRRLFDEDRGGRRAEWEKEDGNRHF